MRQRENGGATRHGGPDPCWRPGLAGRRDAAEVLEEVAVRAQQQARLTIREGLPHRLHRPPELEEFRVLLEGFGEDADGGLLALAAQDLGLRLRLSQQHRPVALGRGADALGLLGTLRALLPGDALALRLHAGQDGLSVFLRQVGAADAHIRHLDAEALRLGVHPLADLAHDPGAVGREHRQQGLAAEGVAQRRGDDGPEPQADAVLRRADGLVEAQRVGDAVAGEGVHHDPPLVAKDHLLALRVEVEQAAVEGNHRLDEGHLHVQPRVPHHPDRLAELGDQHLLGLMHGEERGEDGEERHQEHDRGYGEAVHRVAPCGWPRDMPGSVAVAGAAGRLPARGGSVRFRKGTSPCSRSSTTTFGLRRRISSMVSR